MTNNNKTARKPTAIYTVWDYETGKLLRNRHIFMEPEDLIEAIRELWPGEHAIHYVPEMPGYEGAYGIPQDDRKVPFLYRFELGLL